MATNPDQEVLDVIVSHNGVLTIAKLQKLTGFTRNRISGAVRRCINSGHLGSRMVHGERAGWLEFWVTEKAREKLPVKEIRNTPAKKDDCGFYIRSRPSWSEPVRHPSVWHYAQGVTA